MDVRKMAKVLGRRGGRARAARLPPAERRRIAALGGRARGQSLRVARRITENFRYLAALRDLQGAPPKVRRSSTVEGRLPGIYPTDG
jgi:hypothetical protein